MLPLLSMMIPIDTGTSSRRKILIGCSTPFSSILNADCGMLVSSLPFLSTTLAYSGTRFVSDVKTATSCGSERCLRLGLLREHHTGRKRRQARENEEDRLLSRRIISGAENRLERGVSSGLRQFNLDPPILAVASPVLRRVADHVLIVQLDSDLRRDIRQLRQDCPPRSAARRSAP